MEDNFKVPSLNSSIKFVAKKPSEKDENNKPTIENSEENNKDESTILSNVEKKLDKPKRPQLPKPKIIQPKCSYVEPKWSEKPNPEHIYSLEALKGGSIVETINNLQHKAYWLLGKLPDNDIPMAHPTISRYHAILQYRPDVILESDPNDDPDKDAEDPNADEVECRKSDIEKGWYIYDLASTHGSFVNKMRIPPKTYVRIRVGYMMKFGGSSRSFILQGPEFDAEAESELTITEMKELKRQKEREKIEQQKFQEQKREADGIDWGLSEDADEETDLTINPYATTNNEELFLSDPKKTLRGFFEREGIDLDYRVEEMSAGTFICRIDLPVTDSNGRNVIAEICHKGKKKDCVYQGALEACRILDRHGVLRQANHEPRRKKLEHSDSDEDDDFYDRTGDVERKRQQKVANSNTNALSYEDLLKQKDDLNTKQTEIEQKIEKLRELEKLAKQNANNDDDLDDFISKLSNEKSFDKTEIRRLKVEIQMIKNDMIKLDKLINIARPIDLPPLQLDQKESTSKSTGKKLALPLFGKRGTFKLTTATSVKKEPIPDENKKKNYKSDEEEMDESEPMPRDESPKKLAKSEEIQTSDVDKVEQKDEESTKTKKESIKSSHLNQEMKQSSEKHENNPSTTVMKEKPSLKREHSAEDETTSSTSEIAEAEAAAAAATANKKRRTRHRARNDRGRYDVDIDDAEEMIDETKYSSWIPPENQCGDGSTDLNAKFGY